MSFVRLPTAGVSILLTGVCACLFYILVLTTTSGGGARNLDTPAPPGLTVPPLPELTMGPVETGAAADAPLFHPDRKPYALVAAQTAVSSAAFDDGGEAPFILRGVVLSDGIARASLAHQASGDIRWVTRGGVIDGWQLLQVRPGSVVLGRDDQRTTLRLHAGRRNDPAD